MTDIADRASFRGPYADGPPPEALGVDPPPLRAFGLAELRRLAVIGWVVTVCVAGALARWLLRPKRQSWPAEPSPCATSSDFTK